WSHLARVRGSHLNSMEIFPLFAAAMIAGNMAKLPPQDLNATAFSFIGARIVYIALYTTVSNDVIALTRTGAYAWSIGIPLISLWHAGQKIAASI
ncbi:MAG: hypothetical protein FE78DRAFT_153129, partial [Acidomyces sp. 'richmondensis']